MSSIYRSANDIYQDTDEYTTTYGGASEEEPAFYAEYVGAGEVLYLGSGAGRLLKEFLVLNPKITGVELSSEMIAATKALLPEANIIQENALELSLDQQFDVIIAPYRFFCHFPLPELNTLLGVICKHLKSGGIAVGDIFNPFQPFDRSIRGEVASIEIRNDIVEKVYHLYEHDKQLCTEWIEKIDTKTREQTYLRMPLYYFYPEQLEELCSRHGLKVKDLFGSYQKAPLTKELSELIFVLEKK